jgi:hypothetical protein
VHLAGMALVAVIFNLLIDEVYKFCTFDVTFKDNAAMNYITVKLKNVYSRHI